MVGLFSCGGKQAEGGGGIETRGDCQMASIVVPPPGRERERGGERGGEEGNASMNVCSRDK